MERTAKMNQGQELWKKAKKIIPGGNQLLSKRAEMFLPDGWPAYYKKAKGISVWDLDDNKYLDMSIMGMGTCILGYANEAVDNAVHQAIDEGSMCTLNCPEEVKLAEKLIKLHPWSSKVRFSRSGGEACAIAVRIARSFSKKSKVAFCGYHGWHDWYLAANVATDKNLEGHLLPGLSPHGVPRELAQSAIPFHYGDKEEIDRIVLANKDSLGVIITEVARSKMDVDFLKYLQTLAKKINAVLIFDEVTSGFRMRAGGLHTLYGLEPDIVVLGKALGNGFPISAIVGNERVMDSAQDTFISSSFWTERVGYAAALETINQYEQNDLQQHFHNIGGFIKTKWQQMFQSIGLNIEVAGLDAAPLFIIKEKEAAKIKTIFTQEMLKRGYLASNLIYLSLAHTQAASQEYLREAENVWKIIKRGINQNTLDQLLEGPVCHTGFSRLA